MPAPAHCALILLVAASGASALRDVPKGYCHDCEVTCFEDCAVKFDREIIQADLTGKDRLSRADTAVEAHMKKKMHGVVLRQEPAKNATEALVGSFSSCLAEDKCPCAREAQAKKAPSFLAHGGDKRRCAVGEKKCAVGCAQKATGGTPALAQVGQGVKPGPREDTAAVPWSVNIHPVKINSFATGRQNLETCFKSCLAATCGCDDAPGMEAIDDMVAAIKKNDQAKDPVSDSTPSFQYKHAAIEDCGKGMHGKKITSGLYADLAGGPEGWVEVCSDDFFKAMGKAPDVEKKNCKSSKALLAGCIWDETKSQCVYGLKKLIRCYSRYTDDDKL